MKPANCILFCLVICSLVGLSGCFNSNKKKLNERVTFWRNDKNPYGAWYAYEQLGYLYPEATILNRNTSPGYSKNAALSDLQLLVQEHIYDSGKSLLVILSPTVLPDSNEIEALDDFVDRGNHVLISTLLLGDEFCKSHQLKMADDNDDGYYHDSLELNIRNPENGQVNDFSYPGFGSGYYFENYDSATVEVLGRDKKGHPTFLAIGDSSNGRYFLHSMPFALSNFFLLHKGNKAYYDDLFSQLPANIDVLIWDDFYRNPVKRNAFSALKVIMADRALRWTLYIALIGLAFLIFSEVKRRQKMVPIIEPITNSSLEFVKTVGRLYFQGKDNDNLSVKMVVYFKEFVRTKYSLDVSFMNESFSNALSFKSGLNISEIQALVDQVIRIETGYPLGDQELLSFNQQLERFYKN